MRVSLAWISRLLGGSPAALAERDLLERMGLSVTEIEAVHRSGPQLDGVVVGKVLTCGPHPNADRLRLTTVDIGGAAPLKIVCGAANVAEGLTVAVATIGTTLTVPGKDGARATITIKEASLRGEVSQGMICAEDELGLGPSHDGILQLDGALKPGTPLAAALGVGDTLLEVENIAITHRPDLWGHLGWAREVAALTNGPTIAPPDIGWNDRGAGWSLSITDEGCTTYCAAIVEQVKNGPSPAWMQKLLEACGIRPLGLIVDITNFVMLELGEPMHAFDLRCLQGQSIGVRSATAGERFVTLDGVERTLAAGDLLIKDGGRAVALAGIMGGSESMIRDDTANILLEGAIFRPERIRATRKRTGLATDCSARFEKGLPPELAPAALNRALALIEELSPGCRITHRLHHGPLTGEEREVRFHPSQVERLTGLAVEPAAQRSILERLGFKVSGDRVTVPWWRRKDVSCAADVVEEVARHHGYARIAPAMPRLPAAAPAVNLLRRAEHRARASLSALGWDEVSTASLTADQWPTLLGSDPGILIRPEHPLSSEQTVLRTELAGGLAEALAQNRKHFTQVAIYEVGKRYGIGQGLSARLPALGTGDPDEELVVAGVFAAMHDETPFYAARRAALALVRALGHADAVTLDPGMVPIYLARGRALRLLATVGDKSGGKGGEKVAIGIIGELSAPLRQAAGCPERVGYFCLSLEEVVARLGQPAPVRFRPPSRFQRVEREFTWVCPEDTAFAALANASREAAGPLLESIDLVTVYRGEPIPPGRKAVSLRLALQSNERTLEEAELNEVSKRVVASVSSKTGATLRA